MDRGWVYIISNSAWPGLIKVGYSTNHPNVRAKELKTTGVPTPYKVNFSVIVDNPRALEAKVHKYLRKYHKDGEWFKCSTEIAKAAIEEVHTGVFYDDIDPEKVARESEKLRQANENKKEEERATAILIEKITAVRRELWKIDEKYKYELEASRSFFLDIFITNHKTNDVITRKRQEEDRAIAQIYGTVYFVCNCGHKATRKLTSLNTLSGHIRQFDCPQCRYPIWKISLTGWDVPPFFTFSPFMSSLGANLV